MSTAKLLLQRKKTIGSMEGFIVERNFIFIFVKLILPVQNLSWTFSRLRYSETDTRHLIGEQLCYIRSLTSPQHRKAHYNTRKLAGIPARFAC